MPSEEHTIDQGEALDFDPEFEHLFYSAGLDDCLFDESEEQSMLSQVGDQDLWEDHSSNECIVSFCGSQTRVWKEAKDEIIDLKTNLRNLLKKHDDDQVSKQDIVHLFYGKYSMLYRVFHDQFVWSRVDFLTFVKTCSKLSEFNFTMTHAYLTEGMMDGMMDKAEFIF